MGESYRTINDISSETGYKKGSYVESVVSDLRITESEKRMVESMISCNRCAYPESVKYRDIDTIPGITILGYKLKPCGHIADENFPTRLCRKGLLKMSADRNKYCRNCKNAIQTKTFEVSNDGHMKTFLILHKCNHWKLNENTWCRSDYYCERFTPKENT